MKFAIIAAGEGSRLRQEGVETPKPLVKIAGECMIDRLVRIFRDNDAEEICIIVNTLHPETEQHIRALGAADIRLVVKSTPSSMHSFMEMSSCLGDAPFCLTTVDTVFREQEFADYIRHFKESGLQGCMAVTDYIDDEKPLYVGTDEKLRITGFHDCNEGDRYISGGIYCLHPVALRTLHTCISEGKSRMRNFQRALVDDGLQLEAYPFSKIIDVDHAGDIAKAEQFIRE